jgi:hypothetical protein
MPEGLICKVEEDIFNLIQYYFQVYEYVDA